MSLSALVVPSEACSATFAVGQRLFVQEEVCFRAGLWLE